MFSMEASIQNLQSIAERRSTLPWYALFPRRFECRWLLTTIGTAVKKGKWNETMNNEHWNNIKTDLKRILCRSLTVGTNDPTVTRCWFVPLETIPSTSVEKSTSMFLQNVVVLPSCKELSVPLWHSVEWTHSRQQTTDKPAITTLLRFGLVSKPQVLIQSPLRQHWYDDFGPVHHHSLNSRG